MPARRAGTSGLPVEGAGLEATGADAGTLAVGAAGRAIGAGDFEVLAAITGGMACGTEAGGRVPATGGDEFFFRISVFLIL